MKKNVASQVVGVQMITASDGSAFTGSVTCLVTVDGGTQSASGGTGPTHEGNGFHTYLPTQAETNGDHVAFTFTGTGAIPATVQVYTTFPQTGDNYARIGAPAGASVSADIAAVKTDTAAILLDTGTDGVLLASTATSASLVDAVWDEIITPGTHNVGASAARYLREGSEGIGVTGTAQAGGATSITLASGAVTATNIFNGEQISIIEGTGAGQARLITTSTITTDVCEVHAAWTTNPDSSSVYSIRGADANIAAVRGTVAATCTSIDFDDIATILADTNELQTNQGDWATATGFSTHSAADVWAAATRTLTANTNLNDPTTAAIATAVLTTAMTEAYNTDGSPPTVAQALHLIIAYLMERSVSGTTVTAKKLDGSTTAATFTLDDGTSPTSITRAT